MATIYVRSTDGSNSDNGSTWALAKLDLAGAAAIDSAGDTIYVSDAHDESTASSITLNFAGTLASPLKIICGDDAAEPPTAVATSAKVTMSSATGNITINGSFYCHGILFEANGATSGTGGGIWLSQTAGDTQVYENCDFSMSTSAGSTTIRLGGITSGATKVTWINCNVKFGATGQRVYPLSANFLWLGGSVLSGGSTPTSLFNTSVNTGRSGDWLVSGVDFSNFAATVHFIENSFGCSGKLVLRNCKLPASWSGSLFSAAPAAYGFRGEIYNCDAGDTNYRLWVEDYSGSIKHETTIVRTGGASDGTTSLSWKMATTANAEYPTIILRSPEIVRWNETAGSAITVTVEIVHDSQGSGASSAFTDKEIWLEVQYLGTSGFPLSTFIDDAAADVLATAADQTSSSATWTTTGLSTPVKQKLSVTFTPQEKGFIHAVVCMAGASDTCYVDPLLTVS